MITLANRYRLNAVLKATAETLSDRSEWWCILRRRIPAEVRWTPTLRGRERPRLPREPDWLKDMVHSL